MAGGYRCPSGHTLLPPDGAAVVVCPVCGDTAISACDPTAEERPVFVVSADVGRARVGGQDLTLAHAPDEVAVDQSAPTVSFSPPPASDTPGPSAASLVTLAPPNGSDSSNGSASSVVQFGPTQ